MVKKILFVLSVVLLFACDKEVKEIIDGNGPDPSDNVEKNRLTDASFRVGAAVKTTQLSEPLFANTFSAHFNQLSAEWEMKMELIWSSATSYNWAKADELVLFARNNNMEVHGHTLIWYKSFPNWIKNANLDSIAFESHIKSYIQNVVTRYKGQVVGWDVVNEIFNDNGTLRSVDCHVFKTFNDPIGFYGRCFQYAREADPDAKLFYNDYNVVLASGKRYAIKQMVQRFARDGYPIDGIGDQFHYTVTTNKNQIRNGLNDMASTGLLIHISELDLRVNVNKSDNYVFTDLEQQIQSDAYQFIVESFEAIPQDQKYAISTWGVTDKYTWLTGWWHPKEYPLLFDANYNKKKAYEGFLKGLK